MSSAQNRRPANQGGTATGGVSAPPRHFLDLADFDTATLRRMLDIAAGFKKAEASSRPLAGKTLALIFEKPSTRTRGSSAKDSLAMATRSSKLNTGCLVVSMATATTTSKVESFFAFCSAFAFSRAFRPGSVCSQASTRPRL